MRAVVVGVSIWCCCGAETKRTIYKIPVLGLFFFLVFVIYNFEINKLPNAMRRGCFTISYYVPYSEGNNCKHMRICAGF